MWRIRIESDRATVYESVAAVDLHAATIAAERIVTRLLRDGNWEGQRPVLPIHVSLWQADDDDPQLRLERGENKTFDIIT